MAQEDPSLVVYVVGAIAAGGVAIIGWVGKHTVGRIAALEKGKLDTKQFEEAMARADTSRLELRGTMETHRSETRENVIALHDKIDDKFDGLRNHVDEKFDRLADLIRSRS